MTVSTIRLRRWLLAGLALLLALPATSAVAVTSNCRRSTRCLRPVGAGHRAGPHRGALADRRRLLPVPAAPRSRPMPPSPARPWRCRRGKAYRDEFFGDVETLYRKELLGTSPARCGQRERLTTLTVKYRGCADAGVCYPPQTRTLKVALPGEAGAGGFRL